MVLKGILLRKSAENLIKTWRDCRNLHWYCRKIGQKWL